MKLIVALLLTSLFSSFALASNTPKELSNSFANSSLVRIASPAISKISTEDAWNQKDRTPVLVSSIDKNFYQISDSHSAGSSNAMKLGLLGAAILIGFITHRRMSLNNS